MNPCENEAAARPGPSSTLTPASPVSPGRPAEVHRTSADTVVDVAQRMARVLERIGSGRVQSMDRQDEVQWRRTLDLRAHWNAPRRHVLARPPRGGPWGEKLALLEGRLGLGVLVALIGTGGTGKTQLAVELMKRATADGRSALFRTAMEFFMLLKACYRRDAATSDLEVLRAHKRPRLLVIDEIARHGRSEWETQMLFELLNQRYADMTDTILTCNLSREEFEASIGSALVSRMQETGGIVPCHWPSFRGPAPEG